MTINTKESIKIINQKMIGRDVRYPTYLYKYRPFDAFALDMLENEYLYLCPAERLDDPSECKVNINNNDIYDFQTNRLKIRCIDSILEYIKPYTSNDNFEQLKKIVGQVTTPNGFVKRNYLLDVSFKMQDLVPNIDIVPIINWLGSIPERLEDPDISKRVEKLIFLAMDARKKMGICSLSEEKNSDEMWQKYADNYSGYCIEYDLSDYESLNVLFPVIYEDNRKTNIVNNIVLSFIGEMIFGISNGQIMADRTPYMQMFLTKNTIWDYQKEWRLLGYAKYKIKAPKIKTIYIGKNMTIKCRKNIIKFCRENGINIR